MKFVSGQGKTITARFDPKKVPPEIFPITGIDPGRNTGLVVVSAMQEMPELDPTLYILSLDWGVYLWPEDATELWGAIRFPTVVMEDWRLFQELKTQDGKLKYSADFLRGKKLTGPECLGFIRGNMVKLYGWDTARGEAAHLHMYQPSQRIKQDYLKELWGNLLPTNDHARCALGIVTAHLRALSRRK